MQGKVLQLFISTGNKANPREETNSLTIDLGGVVGDKFYAKDPNRAVLLTSQRSYTLAQENNINLEVGKLGENIFIDINPYTLEDGAKLQIGEVLFEVAQHCTLCKGLSSVDAKLPKLLRDDRGIFIKPLKSGVISLGDKVALL